MYLWRVRGLIRIIVMAFLQYVYSQKRASNDCDGTCVYSIRRSILTVFWLINSSEFRSLAWFPQLSCTCSLHQSIIQYSRKYDSLASSALSWGAADPPNPGTLFPITSSDRPYTLGRACLSPHLFSIKGETAALAPFGQKILDPSSFIGAISLNCCRNDAALEYLISSPQ